MDFITIAGEQREIALTRFKVNKFVTMFNSYYTLATRKVRKEEQDRLIIINKEKDQAVKIAMIDKLVSLIEKQLAQVDFPYYIIEEILWKILAEKERKKFKNMFGRKSKKKMTAAILVDEYQPILDFISVKVLNLSMYNKKKV